MAQRFDHEGAVAKKRKEVRRMIRTRVGAFFGNVIIAAIIFVLVYPRMYITTITTSGFAVSDETAVRDTVRAYLDKKILGIIPHWHRLLIDTPQLKQELKARYPVFQSVAIAIDRQTLSVKVDEERAPYIWCESETADKPFPVCAYLSTSGKLIEEAPYVSETAKLLFHTKEGKIGEIAIAPDLLAKAASYQGTLASLGFDVREITIGIADIECVGRFAKNSSERTMVYASLQDDPKTVAAYTEVLLRDVAFAQSFISKPLEYIDARFGKILYYRFQ